MQATGDPLRNTENAQQIPASERLEPLRGARGDAVAEPWDAQAAVRAAANQELHADVLEQGAGRLFGILLLSACALSACLFYELLLAPRTDVEPMWSREAGLLTGALGLSATIFGLAKLSRARPQIVRDLGYVYLLGLCLLLSLIRHGHPLVADALVSQVSPITIPILAFAALIPASPRTALATSLGAAGMDSLAMYFLRSRTSMSMDEVALSLASPLLAALVAFQISRVVHRLSEGIVKAREVGSYRLVERLGVGGMAEVWRADHRMLARPAAVKLIRPEVLTGHGPQASERLVRLFLREARATSQLNSPNTIQLYDFGITREGAFYYVMELLDGVDLKALVERFGPQSSERTAHLLRQICRSLSEAHAQSFVHRDIKPANVFTCRYGGETDFVKVLDFGLVLDRHPTAEELEDEKRFVGTPSVMAPEMVRFQAPVDARADIYAVGCIGYWLLTGRHVFEAQTRADMLVMHAHQKPILPSKRLGAPLHAELEAVIMNCLEKNPGKRPQTARELGERLGALTFDTPWTEERSELWWRRYAPTRKPEGTDEDAANEPAPRAAPEAAIEP